MGFGNVGVLELIFVLAIWAIPLVIVAWFIHMLQRISNQLRDISHRLMALERTVQDLPPIRRVP